MTRRVLAGALGLALVGCAQTRSALPIGRVRLEPETPLDQAINRKAAPNDPAVVRAGDPAGASSEPAGSPADDADAEAPAALILPGLPATEPPPGEPKRDPAVKPAAATAPAPAPADDGQRIPAGQSA